MSKTTVSLDMQPQRCPPRIHAVSPKEIDVLRRQLLRLALAETQSTDYLHEALRLVSDTLHIPALFVSEHDTKLHNHTEPFMVAAQNKSIGTLLIDKNIFETDDLSRDSIQEVADIIGLSLLSLQQGEELEAVESESEEMLQYAPDVIFLLGETGIIRMANHKAHELLGAASGTLKDRSIQDILNHPTMNELFQCARSGEKFEVEITGTRGRRLASFTVSLLAQDGNDHQLLMVGRDITTERQAELALRRSERATLMAQTIDYLLHEVNNPLGALLSGVSTVLRQTEKLQKLVADIGNSAQDTPTPDSWMTQLESQLVSQNRMLQSARKSGSRLAEAMKMLRLVNQKRTLSDAKSVDPAFELGLAISAMELDHQTIQVEKNLVSLPMLDAPPLHLAEIFGSILKNSAEALESISREPKQIVVTGQNNDKRVIITVEDNGPGIPADQRQRVFMPFYTTKPLGNAIGLGLSMALDMTKRVGGTIQLDASPRLGGACVTVTFPVQSAYPLALPSTEY